jgi:hypothetical protein
VNAFDETRAVERRALEMLDPFLRAHAFDGRRVYTNKGPLSAFLQRSVGDVLINLDVEGPDCVSTIEVKAEERERPTLFLETWSNRSRRTPGWMVTQGADFLFYLFLDTRTLHIMRLSELQDWAFGKGRRSCNARGANSTTHGDGVFRSRTLENTFA